MVTHVVFYRPRPDASGADLRRLIGAIERAAGTVAHVRRCWVGRALPDAPTYRRGGIGAFPYCAVLEFEDRAGLEAYLGDASHEELGRLFNETAEAAVVGDFLAAEPPSLGDLFTDVLPTGS
jgi:hypothetical protein